MDVIAFSILLGSIFWFCNTSTNTGFALKCIIEAVDAIKEFGGVITSSFFPTPNKWSDNVKASVPLFSATAYFTFKYFLIFSSNLSTSLPPTK